MSRPCTLSRAITLAAVGALAGTLGCSDPTAASSAVAVIEPSRSEQDSPPPPPPIDTMAVGYDEGASNSAFAIRLTYFLNQTGNNTWLAFHLATPSSSGEQTASASPEARIRFRGDKVWTNGSLLIGGSTLDLSKGAVDFASSSLGPCTQRQGTEQSIAPACGTLRLSLTDASGTPRIYSFEVGYTPAEAAARVSARNGPRGDYVQ